MARIQRRRAGKYEFLSLVTVLFMTLLIGFLANIGYTVRKKIEVQNAADSIAYSSAVWAARGMNTITATNHLMGELTGLVAWHDAIAGHVDEDYHEEQGRKGSPTWARVLFAGMLIMDVAVRAIREFALDTFDFQGSVAFEEMLEAADLSPDLLKGSSGSKPKRDKLQKDKADEKDKGTEQGWIEQIEEMQEMKEDYDEAQKWEKLSESEFDPIECSGTIRDSKLVLMIETSLVQMAYIAAFAKYVAESFACLGALIGFPLCEAAVYRELQLTVRAIRVGDTELAREWKYLTMLEEVSERLAFGPKTFVKWMIPNGASFATEFKDEMPRLTANTAEALGEKLSVKAGLSGLGAGLNVATFLGGKSLPLERQEPEEELMDEKNARIQLLRASWPWVKYLRRPMFPVFAIAPLSGAPGHYVRYTALFAREWAWRLQKERPVYVLTGTTTENKGKETWTSVEGSREAEQMFGMVGFAIRDRHSVASQRVWGKPMVNSAAFAQAMIYNGNQQEQPPVEPGNLQPEVGWDTLNWTPPAAGNSAYEFDWLDQLVGVDSNVLTLLPMMAVTIPISVTEGLKTFFVDPPRAHINWQAKLVPATAVKPTALDPRIVQFLNEAEVTPAFSSDLITH